MKRRCIYTALIGSYEKFNDFEVDCANGIRLICFTDDTRLVSKNWEIRHVTPIFPMDPIRSQRAFKVLPHHYLPDFDESIYIDNTVKPHNKFYELFDLLDESGAFALSHHSFRDTVMDEFLEVARLGLDDGSRIFEQMNHYLLTDDEVLSQRPYWGGLLIRNHAHPLVRRTMDVWWAHINRYSRRDQLSINFAIHSIAPPIRIIDIDNHVSSLHSWPHPTERQRFAGMRDPSTSYQPVAARARRLDKEVEALQANLKLAEENLTIVQTQYDELKEQHDLIKASWDLIKEDRDQINSERDRIMACLQKIISELDMKKMELDHIKDLLNKNENYFVKDGSHRLLVDGAAYVREGTVAASLSRRLSSCAVRYPAIAAVAKRALIQVAAMTRRHRS